MEEALTLTQLSKKIIVAVDAMGSERSPQVEIEGVIAAVKEYPGVEVVLVGLETLKEELVNQGAANLPITVVSATETIGMGESPLQAIKTKKNSSLVIAAELVRDKKAHALVSAGNTGATMAAALMILGRIKGVSRPAIATVMPSKNGGTVLLDAGANVDCKPQYLQEFAVMGSIYGREILKKKDPRVGLLNIGEERGKGCAQVLEAYDLLAKTPLNFIGNVEGRDILNGKCDVVVCDGFIGNIVLKFGEGLVSTILEQVKQGILKNFWRKIGGFLVSPVFKELKKKLDYSEYGGAPLLGVDGVCIISHGSSNAKAIKNAVRIAAQFVREGVNDHIQEDIKKIQSGRHEQ